MCPGCFQSKPGKGFCVISFTLACFLLVPGDGFPLEPGDYAPGFELPTLNNDQQVKLEDLRGKVVYVDFWASWCGPCRKSLPLYESMYSRFQGDRFEILAINLDEDRRDAEGFLEKHPVSYTILLDPAGITASQWQIQAMPSSFLLDANGMAIRSWAGFTPAHLEEIQHEIRTALH